jgi:hypothetical protein
VQFHHHAILNPQLASHDEVGYCGSFMDVRQDGKCEA